MNAFYITGTSRGIGYALAEKLLKIPENRVFGISRSVAITHERYQHIKMDLRNEKAVSKFRFKPPPRAQRLVLVNNAGVISPVAPVGRLDNRALSEGFTINLISPTLLINQFIQETKNRRAERLVINISSGAAKHAIDSWAGYCAGKAGLDMFSEVLQSEQPLHSPKNPVRAFSIAPGVVDTDMQRSIRATPKKDFASKDRFVEMKKSGVLVSADKTAQALLKIIDQPDRYTDVCLDLRDL